MQKILGCLLALTLAISFVNCSSFAEDFDPIADLAATMTTDETDILLNLDLPENLDEMALPEIPPAIPATEPALPTTPETYLPGSGGVIEDSPPEIQNSFVPQPIYPPATNEIEVVNYPSSTQLNLVETGPESIFWVALLAALPLAWLLRKFLYV